MVKIETNMDTIFIAIILFHLNCDYKIEQHGNSITTNKKESRFKDDFQKADSLFNKTYEINITELKKASSEAAYSAFLKTKDKLKKGR